MSNTRKSKKFTFAPTYKTLEKILTDHNLATLGDAYTNFLYSLYLSMKTGKPAGAKASSQILSKALKQAGLRDLMSSRVDRHNQADAAEALLVYTWLQGQATITESVNILAKHEKVADAFGYLLADIRKKLDL